jgi:hypothetical protein
LKVTLMLSSPLVEPAHRHARGYAAAAESSWG